MSWYKNGGSWDSRDQKTGSFSLFIDVDLLVWLLGFRFDIDPHWIDFGVSLGPIILSVIYWRRYY